MTYARERDLPSGVRSWLPAPAQRVFRAAYNLARQDRRDEDTAYRLAWGAAQRDALRRARKVRKS